MKYEAMIRHIAETSKLEYHKLLDFFEGMEENIQPDLLIEQIGFTKREFRILVRKLKKYANLVDKNQ